MAKTLLKLNDSRLEWIPSQGEHVPVTELATHSLGCRFLVGEDLRTPALETAVDRLSLRLALDFGRYDVRSPDESALRRGEFQVVEFNGLTERRLICTIRDTARFVAGGSSLNNGAEPLKSERDIGRQAGSRSPGANSHAWCGPRAAELAPADLRIYVGNLAVSEAGPVLVGFNNVPRPVFEPGLHDALAVVQVELAIDDRPGFRIDARGVALGHGPKRSSRRIAAGTSWERPRMQPCFRRSRSARWCRDTRGYEHLSPRPGDFCVEIADGVGALNRESAPIRIDGIGSKGRARQQNERKENQGQWIEESCAKAPWGVLQLGVLPVSGLRRA